VNAGVSRVASLEAALAAASTAKLQATLFSSLPVALLTINGYSMDTETSFTFNSGRCRDMYGTQTMHVPAAGWWHQDRLKRVACL